MQSKTIVAPPSDPKRTVRWSAYMVVACAAPAVVGSGFIKDQFSGAAKLDHVRWLNG